MANRLKPKISVSEDILSSKIYDKEGLENRLNNSLQSPFEIFRNNTTAVEVIVKEIKHKGNNKIITNVHKSNGESTTFNRLNGDIEKLKSELLKANSNLDEARRCFKVILCEMKKQLEAANQRELRTQTKNLALQLEKEKLRTTLESKSNLVTKLKRELLGIKRVLKVVLKGMRFATPRQETIYHSDAEYDEFEKDLRNSALIGVTDNSFNKDSVLESLMTSKT